MGNKMVADIGTDSFGSIGAFIPFLILEALVVICIACLPMLVSSVSGNLQQMGVLAAGRLAAGGLGTMASAGMRSFGAARSIASIPAQTLRGQNALGRAGQAFGAHPAVQRASTGVALTLTGCRNVRGSYANRNPRGTKGGQWAALFIGDADEHRP